MPLEQHIYKLLQNGNQRGKTHFIHIELLCFKNNIGKRNIIFPIRKYENPSYHAYIIIIIILYTVVPVHTSILYSRNGLKKQLHFSVRKNRKIRYSR